MPCIKHLSITMVRLFLVFATLLALLQEAKAQADLACTALETQANDLVKTDAGAVCECKEGDNSLEYTCTVDSVCLTSGENGAAYAGSISTIAILDGLDSASYAQKTILRLCFDYNDDLYGGAKVCHETIPDTLGGLGLCSIKVDGVLCELCEFCPGRDENFQLRSAFDCSNVGGEEARVCTSDYSNNTDSILRFLASPQMSTECEGIDDTTTSAAHTASLLFSVLMVTVLPFVFV